MTLTRKFEQCIAFHVASALIAAGYDVTVNDGEEDTLKRSIDPHAIVSAMMTTDEDYLIARSRRLETVGEATTHRRSFVRFVYGNDGWDVVNDYGTSLDAILEPVIGSHPTSIASRLERGDFLITF